MAVYLKKPSLLMLTLYREDAVFMDYIDYTVIKLFWKKKKIPVDLKFES